MTHRKASSWAAIVLAFFGCGDDGPASAVDTDSADDGSGGPLLDCDAPVGRFRLVPRTPPTCMNELQTLEVREAAGGRVRLISENFDLEASANAMCGLEGLGCSFIEPERYDDYEVLLTADALTIAYRSGANRIDRYELDCEETVTFDLQPTEDCNVSGVFVLDSEFVSGTRLEGVCAELSPGNAQISVDAGASELLWFLDADSVVVDGCVVRAESETNWGPDFQTVGPRAWTLDLTIEGPVARGSLVDEWSPEGEDCRSTGEFTATRRLTNASGQEILNTYTIASGAACEEQGPASCGDGVCETGRESCRFCPEDCGCAAGTLCEGDECVAACDPLDATTCDAGERCELMGGELICVESTGSAGLGESCGGSTFCAGGLSCDATSADGICAPTCATAGGDCETLCVADEGDAYGACSIACRAHETGTCPGGAICRSDILTDEDRCVPGPTGTLLPLGSACNQASDCEEGLGCIGINGAPSVCVQLCETDAHCPAAAPMCLFGDYCT